DIKLTMNVYTDPKLLDVRGALAALPALPLPGDLPEAEALRATGTDARLTFECKPLAPTLAPTADDSGQLPTVPVCLHTGDPASSLAVSGERVNGKGRLSVPDNRPSCRGDWIRTSDLLNPIQAR